jgi:hypothetical protein
MVHQYPNREVVEGTVALAGVPTSVGGMTGTYALTVEPRVHHAKVAFNIEDIAIDKHRGTRVPDPDPARICLFVGFSPLPVNPLFGVVRWTTEWRVRSFDRSVAKRREMSEAASIIAYDAGATASSRSRRACGRSPGARLFDSMPRAE